MKRFHVHLSVNDLDASLRFYARLFGAEPTVRKDDYAKWLLDDPPLNFAISNRAAATGLNHLGIQVDSEPALGELRAQAAAADLAAVDEPGAACCYARSDKYWIEDPQGIAWETFRTLGEIPLFGAAAPGQSTAAGACCVPKTAAGGGLG